MTGSGETDTGRYVWLAGDYPRLSRDIRRNLRTAAARLTGRHAAITLTQDPAAWGAAWPAVSAAWRARCEDRGRPADLGRFRITWCQASELAVLTVAGELAAWALADPQPGAYRVLAGQMTPGFAAYRPGRVLEAVMVARAQSGAPPWDDLPAEVAAVTAAVRIGLGDGEWKPHPWIDWGEGHPEALLTCGAS